MSEKRGAGPESVWLLPQGDPAPDAPEPPDTARRSGLVFRAHSRTRGLGPHALTSVALELEARTRDAETERELVAALVRVLSSVLPGREVFVRLRSGDGLPDLIAATSLPPNGIPRALGLSRAAAVRHDLLDAPLPFDVAPGYTSIFWEMSSGIDAPLLDGSDVVGTVSLEFPPGGTPEEIEVLAVVIAANQFSSALRRLRLSEETRALSQRLLLLGTELDALRGFSQRAASAAHEINNPLTGIEVEAAYLIRKAAAGPLETRDLDRLARIERDALRVEQLARDIVTDARPTADAARAHPVHEVLDEAVVFCEHAISAARVRIGKRYAHKNIAVIGARRQLHQIFINVITNACQAMAAHGGDLVLDVRADGTAAIISVSDNGPGIADRDLGRIFDPFFTTKEGDRGTGLGLAIVQRLVREHGGEVRVFSTPGRGTTFDIVLPSPGPSVGH